MLNLFLKWCVMALCVWCIQCYACMCNYKCAFANSIYVHVYGCVSVCSFGVFYPELMADDNVDSQGESERNWFIAKNCQTWADIPESHTSVLYAREIHAWLGKSDSPDYSELWYSDLSQNMCVWVSWITHQCVLCPWDSCMTGEKWLTWLQWIMNQSWRVRICVFISFSLSVYGHVSCIWNPGM